jgi:PleD family two-component response regulator
MNLFTNLQNRIYIYIYIYTQIKSHTDEFVHKYITILDYDSFNSRT